MNATPRFSPAALESEIRARADLFARAARRVNDASDNEAIHALRVSARRLNAMLDLWRHMLRNGPRRRAQRSLGRLRRRLGDAREHEVHAEMLVARLEQFPPTSRIAVAPILERLTRTRDRARAAAALRTEPQRIHKFLARIASASRDLRNETTVPLDALRIAMARCAEREQLGREAVAIALSTPQDEPMHDARIAIKKWRYTLEGLRFVRGKRAAVDGSTGPSTSRLALLRRLQQALGDVQDIATLLDVIRVDLHRYQRAGLDEAAEALGPLVSALEIERHEASKRFRTLAPELGFAAPHPARSAPRAEDPAGDGPQGAPSAAQPRDDEHRSPSRS